MRTTVARRSDLFSLGVRIPVVLMRKDGNERTLHHLSRSLGRISTQLPESTPCHRILRCHSHDCRESGDVRQHRHRRQRRRGRDRRHHPSFARHPLPTPRRHRGGRPVNGRHRGHRRATRGPAFTAGTDPRAACGMARKGARPPAWDYEGTLTSSLAHRSDESSAPPARVSRD